VNTPALTVPLILIFGAVSLACRREARRFGEPPAANRLPAAAAPAAIEHENLARYGGNAWAMSEGQRLYGQMNCSGCHGHGGGGAIGPALMDARFRHGAELEDIERVILLGTARGMPSFKDKLSPQQVWQLASYVRALGGRAPSAAAPVRDDHMAVRPPPSRTEPEPVQRDLD
jgi:cytochrome c oxidase cbb3-type subunit 3